MKNKIIVRKDLNISFNDLVTLIAANSCIISKYDTDIASIEVLEAFNLQELYDLEEKLITDGEFFEWVGYQSIVIINEKEKNSEPFKAYEPDVIKDNVNETLEAFKEKRKELSKN